MTAWLQILGRSLFGFENFPCLLATPFGPYSRFNAAISSKIVVCGKSICVRIYYNNLQIWNSKFQTLIRLSETWQIQKLRYEKSENYLKKSPPYTHLVLLQVYHGEKTFTIHYVPFKNYEICKRTNMKIKSASCVFVIIRSHNGIRFMRMLQTQAMTNFMHTNCV